MYEKIKNNNILVISTNKPVKQPCPISESKILQAIKKQKCNLTNAGVG